MTKLLRSTVSLCKMVVFLAGLLVTAALFVTLHKHPDAVTHDKLLLIEQKKRNTHHQKQRENPQTHEKLDRISPDVARYRLQLSYEGKCVGSSSRASLDVVFCDPTQHQTFQLMMDGKIVFDRTGKCVVTRDNSPQPGSVLKLGECSRAVRFEFVNDSYLQVQPVESRLKFPLCISPLSSSTPDTPASSPARGDLVGLTTCHQNASSLNLIEESEFQTRRRALLLPPLRNRERCDFPACGINKRAPPVVSLSGDVERCKHISSCVTVVVKTARRPHLVLRLATSIRHVMGYDLPMIVYDDGVGQHPEKIRRKLRTFPKLRYIVGDKVDLGISLGRTLAVKLVKTKYFLLLDDDTILNKNSDIQLLIRILDTTDASLVGGKVAGNSHFAGYFRFTRFGTNPRDLYHYIGACHIANETLVDFPACMRCDTTTNIFMAKTADVLEVGGWSEEIKIKEHKDLFLRLKAGGKKVVYCPEFTADNVKEKPIVSNESGYSQFRALARAQRMSRMFANVWNIDRVFEHTAKTFVLTRNLTLMENP